MKPDRHVGLEINEVGVDPHGVYVLVTNCRCQLPHDSPEAYREHHSDGCLMKPWEGLVFEMSGNAITRWGMEILTRRPLAPVPAEKADDIKRQMFEIMEKDRKKRKAENFKGRRVW
jgi:hypothetical protein